MKASISPFSVASRRENRVPADKLCDAATTMQAFKNHTHFRNALLEDGMPKYQVPRRYLEHLGHGFGVGGVNQE